MSEEDRVSTEDDTPSQSPPTADQDRAEQPEEERAGRPRPRTVRDILLHGEKRGGQAMAVGGRVPRPVSERPAAPPGPTVPDQPPSAGEDAASDGQGG
ncbi:hypothetical protein [Streptomyces brasiliensis]|uniref:Uncharacterized protein n=1 Tax=Streptomyces brasiliensis TaxID=1954 RepID=A0A917NH95_9ACTN|nr:hypothetical protein [Streptomyces brasiliensis]GGI97848.1 hypothetical protein GCM10010121_005100 [Streptomyces brasiliensis]